MRLTPPFKMRITKKEWKLLFVCVIILAIVLLDVVIRRVYTKFSNLENEIKLTEARLGRLKEIFRQREQIDSEHEKIVAGLEKIKASDDFLQEIEDFAGSAGLSIRNIRPTATKEEDLYRIYSVKIDTRSQVSTVARFLYVFTKEFKGMGIGRLQINALRQRELPEVSLLISAIGFKD